MHFRNLAKQQSFGKEKYRVRRSTKFNMTLLSLVWAIYHGLMTTLLIVYKAPSEGDLVARACREFLPICLGTTSKKVWTDHWQAAPLIAFDHQGETGWLVAMSRPSQIWRNNYRYHLKDQKHRPVMFKPLLYGLTPGSKARQVGPLGMRLPGMHLRMAGRGWNHFQWKWLRVNSISLFQVIWQMRPFCKDETLWKMVYVSL